MNLAIQQVSGQFSVLRKTMPHKREGKGKEGKGRGGEERGGKGRKGKSTLTTKSMYICICL